MNVLDLEIKLRPQIRGRLGAGLIRGRLGTCLGIFFWPVLDLEIKLSPQIRGRLGAGFCKENWMSGFVFILDATLLTFDPRLVCQIPIRSRLVGHCNGAFIFITRWRHLSL
jgi:hypothetical protein